MKPTIKRPLHDSLKTSAALLLVLGSAGSITSAQEPNRLIFYLHGRILRESVQPLFVRARRVRRSLNDIGEWSWNGLQTL